jgi:hypothetical protein
MDLKGLQPDDVNWIHLVKESVLMITVKYSQFP